MPVLWSMRALLATGIVVTLAALAGGAEAREVSIYRGPCGEAVLPGGPTGLESALRIRTACGVFVADGRGVRFVGTHRPAWKHDGLLARHGRLVFYDRDRVRWRSRGRNYRAVSWVAATQGSLAFQWYGSRLHVADLDGPERAVGRLGEYPLGWTRAGLLVTSQEHVLRARSRAGRLVGVLERRAGTRIFDPRTRTLIYVSRSGALVRTDGRRSQRLIARGLRRWIGIWPLESGRVALTDRRLTVLDSDGSPLASDRLRGNLAGLTARGAIAMVSTGRFDSRSRSTEWVRLLRPGARSSTLLLTTKVGALGCGHWPTLSWRGDELLYSTTEGHVVVMKPTAGEQVDLTSVVKRLPGKLLHAGWS